MGRRISRRIPAAHPFAYALALRPHVVLRLVCSNAFSQPIAFVQDSQDI
jgi:hypothetical protein